jgi:hypothetical protein
MPTHIMPIRIVNFRAMTSPLSIVGRLDGLPTNELSIQRNGEPHSPFMALNSPDIPNERDLTGAAKSG